MNSLRRSFAVSLHAVLCGCTIHIADIEGSATGTDGGFGSSSPGTVSAMILPYVPNPEVAGPSGIAAGECGNGPGQCACDQGIRHPTPRAFQGPSATFSLTTCGAAAVDGRDLMRSVAIRYSRKNASSSEHGPTLPLPR